MKLCYTPSPAKAGERKHMAQRKYSQTEREKIIRAYKARSVSLRTFVKQYGISHTTLLTWMKTSGPTPNTAPHELDFHHLEARNKALEEQLCIIKECRFFPRIPLRTRLDEMRRLAKNHSVHALSAALDVSRGTYYNDVLRAKGEDAWFNRRRKQLTPMIRQAFDKSHGAYGAEQITSVLRLDGIKADVRTVAKIMVECGLESNRNTAARAYKRTRFNRRNELKLREAEFTAESPNELWVCDVAEFQVGKCHTKIYLCAIVDVFARKAIAYKFGRANNTRLAKATFLKAYNERHPKAGLIFHSDRGAPNVSRRFYDCLKGLNVTQSLSRPHIPQDNAVIESFFRNLKSEIYYPRQYNTAEELMSAIASYMEEYNAIRPHSFNGGIPPNKAESEHWQNSSAKAANPIEPRGFDSVQSSAIVQ